MPRTQPRLSAECIQGYHNALCSHAKHPARGCEWLGAWPGIPSTRWNISTSSILTATRQAYRCFSTRNPLSIGMDGVSNVLTLFAAADLCLK